MDGHVGMIIPITAAVGALAHLLLLGVRRGWETMAGVDELRQALGPLRDQWTAENEVFLQTRSKVEAAGRRLSAAEQRLKQIEREIAEVQRTPPSFLHTLGQPGPNVRPFRAEVMFDSTAARAAGRAVNPVWHRDNRLVIHATDLEAARREADRVFPEKGGFMKQFAGASAR